MVNANLEIFVAVSVLGLGLILFAVGVLSWLRLKSNRALWVTLGFLALAIKGGYLTQVSYATRGSEGWVLVSGILDLVLGLCFYIAMRRP